MLEKNSKKTVWIIHQYASTPETGMGGRHYYLAEELGKLGYRVYVIAAAYHHLLRKPPKVTRLFTMEERENFTIMWMKMPYYAQAHSKKRVWNWFLFSWKLQKLPKFLVDKPEAILCSSPSPIPFLGAEKLAKKLKARLIFEVRDIWPLTLIEIGGYSPKHPFIRFMQWVEDRAYKNSDRVISNLRNAVEHMEARGMERERFSWIPNGVSLAEISKTTPLNEAAKKQLPRDKFIIGYAGTLGVANALDTLLEAASLLKGDNRFAFVLVGGGKEKKNLQDLANRLGLTNVYFIDPIPKKEIQAMLKEFDLSYIGLTNDPLFRFGVSPNKLFDYLYAGKPILYAIDSGKYRPIEDLNVGRQLTPQNSKELADAIQSLSLLTADERDNLSKRARKAVLENYEYSKLAKKLSKVLFDEI